MNDGSQEFQPKPAEPQKPRIEPAKPPAEPKPFDPNETLHEKPIDPEIEKARAELRASFGTGEPEGSTQNHPRDVVNEWIKELDAQKPPPKKPNPITEKVGATIGRMWRETKQASIMFWQLGGIRPGWVDGGIHWIATPSARISDDPNQWKYSDTSDQFFRREFDALKKQGIRTIGERELMTIGAKYNEKIRVPTLRPIPPADLQYMDHTRIKAAEFCGMKIRVQFEHRIESYS